MKIQKITFNSVGFVWSLIKQTFKSPVNLRLFIGLIACSIAAISTGFGLRTWAIFLVFVIFLMLLRITALGLENAELKKKG